MYWLPEKKFIGWKITSFFFGIFVWHLILFWFRSVWIIFSYFISHEFFSLASLICSIRALHRLSQYLEMVNTKILFDWLILMIQKSICFFVTYLKLSWIFGFNSTAFSALISCSKSQQDVQQLVPNHFDFLRKFPLHYFSSKSMQKRMCTSMYDGWHATLWWHLARNAPWNF